MDPYLERNINILTYRCSCCIIRFIDWGYLWRYIWLLRRKVRSLYAKSLRSIDGYTKFNINHFVYFSITTWHFFYHSSFNHNWLGEYGTYRTWTDATVKRARVYYGITCTRGYE